MELLIRVKNKETAPDIYTDVQRTKRGDIIAVCPDGWKWSDEENKNPFWRIIRVPTLAKIDSVLYDKDEHAVRVMKDGANIFDKSATSQKRGYAFDLNSAWLSPEMIKYLNDDNRASPSFVVQDISGLIIQKQAIADPKVFAAIT